MQAIVGNASGKQTRDHRQVSNLKMSCTESKLIRQMPENQNSFPTSMLEYTVGSHPTWAYLAGYESSI